MEHQIPTAARVAYDSFGHNINIANAKIANLKVRLESRLNHIPVWGTLRRKRIETDLQQIQERIANYKQAREGILIEDYTTAVKILLQEADQLVQSETPYETAKRVTREPATLGAILHSPNSIASRMRQTAQELESLSS